MNFDPGSDWRIAADADIKGNPEYVAHYTPDGDLELWVPNVPADALPTDALTVISVSWKYGKPTDKNIAVLHDDGLWHVGNYTYLPDNLLEQISDFKIESSPFFVMPKHVADIRKQATKDALERRHALKMEGHEFPDEQIAAEFGFDWL